MKAKEKLLTAQINWLDDTIKLALVDSGYTPDIAQDEFLSDVIDYHIVAQSSALTGKSVQAGVAYVSDVTIQIFTGVTFNYLVLYKELGDLATSPLIALIDSAPNLPFTLETDSVTISFDNNGIFNI